MFNVRGFLSDRFNLGLIVVLLLLGSYFIFLQPHAIVPPAPTDGEVVLDFFYLPTCPHCAEQKEFHIGLLERHPGLTIISHDVTFPHEQGLLVVKLAEAGMLGDNVPVPVTSMGGNLFIGFDGGIGRSIEAAVEGSEVESSVAEEEEPKFTVGLPFLGEVYLLDYSLPVIAIVLGLVDGFNPCAMWVLVYLIALLMDIGDKKRIWLIVGTFVAASGILYFLFMTAWLNAFLMLGYIHAVTVLVGLVALGGGILSIKEFLQTRGPLVCKVGDPVEKRRTMERAKMLAGGPLTVATFVGIVALAFAVNSVEFVCSAALPAIFAQVLSVSGLSGLEHYLYIGLYVLFFMLDDLLIFGLAAFAVTNTSVGEKYSKISRIVGGIILLLLGLMLLFAPSALVVV